LVLVDLGFGLRASALRRRRRRRRGISPLKLFLAPATLHSGVDGELVEVVFPAWNRCTGVVRHRLAGPVGR